MAEVSSTPDKIRGTFQVGAPPPEEPDEPEEDE